MLDGTTGQNALVQAREFGEVADLTGIILTKMDGTAKGGIAVAIQSELKVPVKYIGVGESIEDLQKFNSDEFVNALFDVNMDDIRRTCICPEERSWRDRRGRIINRQTKESVTERHGKEKCRKKC